MAQKKFNVVQGSGKEQFKLFTAFILFILFFISDFVSSLYVIFIGRDLATKAAIASAVLTGLGLIGYHKFQRQPWYIIPIILGVLLGTYISVKLF